MAGTETEGYVLIACGNEGYLEMANNLISTLRKHGDNRPVHIITEDQLDKDDPVFQDCKTPFEMYGTYPKINLDKFLMYDHTIFLDSDILCVGNTDHVWELFRSNEQYVQQLGKPKPTKEEIKKNRAGHAPLVHGGVIYYNKKNLDPKFFEFLRDKFMDYRGSKSYKGSRTDQILYSGAFREFKFKPINIYNNPVMTVGHDVSIIKPPIYKVWFKRQNGPDLDTPIPFIHIFRGKEGVRKRTKSEEKHTLQHYQFYLNYEQNDLDSVVSGVEECPGDSTEVS